jgi:hypothetical protein
MADVEHPHRERLPFAPERSAATAHLPEGPPGRAWRRLDRIVLALTLLGLLGPGALLLAGVHARPIENRPLVAFPKVTTAGVLDGSWFRGVDAYLADNLPPRSYAVRLRGEVFYRSGGTGNPQVLRGRDGWLFTRAEFDGGCPMSAADITAALGTAVAALEAKGIAFRFVGVPDKHAIYPEQVASNPFAEPCTDAQRPALRAALAGMSPNGIDGWSVLEAAKAASDEPLYYRADTHWTPFGALQVVRALVTSIDPALWSDADVEISGTRPRTVDLALQLGIRRVESPARVRVRPGVELTRTDLSVPVDIRNARAIFETRPSAGRPILAGRTLILYDSFFGIDVPLVSPYFGDAVWVHVGDMQNHPELATILGPFDTVILERVERGLYLSDLPKTLGELER